MRFLLNFFLIFGLFIFTIYNSFAIDAPLNLKVDSINDTTVDLSWDNVDNGYMYYISYGKNSGGSYDNQTDYLESNTGTVSGLEAGNTYYFVVKALDENGDESNYSNEVSADIPEENVFSLESVVANNKKQIELTFSRKLDSSTGSVREFKVYEKSDNINLYDVLSTELDKNNSTKLILNLDRDL
ncbi:fibronectin type III domain-containing protein, partial [Candidatus Gracilibacteria bacterium]|nr:fibronectin type III domain-containing protein [Candidatus Gracilibacteria bacterium]